MLHYDHDRAATNAAFQIYPLDQGLLQSMRLNKVPGRYDRRSGRAAVIAAVVLLAAITAALLLSPLTFGAAPAPAQPLPFEGRVNQVTTADQHEPTLAV